MRVAAAIECETSNMDEVGPLFDDSAISGIFQYLDLVTHIGTKTMEGGDA